MASGGDGRSDCPHFPHFDACKRLLNNSMTKKCIMSGDGSVQWVGHDQKLKSYPGVTNALRESMYPTFQTDHRFYYGSSSAELGTRIHRQIYHVVMCGDYEKCETKTVKLHPWVKKAFDLLISEKLYPESCEVPIISEIGLKATRVDMICTRNKGDPDRESSVLVSVKTRHRGLQYDLEDPFNMLEPPFEKVYSNPKNHDQLQLCCETAILRHEYKIEFDEHLILYLNVRMVAGDSADAAPEDEDTADLVRMEPWAEDPRAQVRLLSKLRDFRRRGGKFSSGQVKRKRAGGGSGKKPKPKPKKETKRKRKSKE
jgi:hypothetical protein